MNSNGLAKNYEMMQPMEQLKHLLRLSFNLTVVARNTYTAGGDDVDRPKALRGIVEICHKTIGRIQSISSDNFIMPIDDFCKSIYEIANVYGCMFELENAIAFSDES